MLKDLSLERYLKLACLKLQQIFLVDQCSLFLEIKQSFRAFMQEYIRLTKYQSSSGKNNNVLLQGGRIARIAQWIALSLGTQRPRVWFSGSKALLMLLRFIERTAKNSGQSLDNDHQIHLVHSRGCCKSSWA